MKRDMYFEGKIYKNFDEFNGLLLITDEEYLSQFTSFPVIPPHSFTEGQEVVEGKDYEKNFEVCFDNVWQRVVSTSYDNYKLNSMPVRIAALPLAQPVQPEDVSNLQKIEYWTKQYEFSFQFWGEGNNNVFINRGYVEIASFGGGDSINEILEDTIAWCEKANPRFNYSK